MKLDIDALRKAVNQKLVSEQFVGFAEPIDIHQGSHTSYPEHDYHIEEDHEEHTDGGDEMEMVKQNLFQLSVYAAKLHDLMQEDDDVEEWVQEKIVEATSKISDVYHYLEYQAYKKSK
jgi:hypothetical protein